LLVVSLGGCGSSNSLTREEQDVLDVVYQLDVGDPGVCRSLTPAFVKRIFGSREACIAAARKQGIRPPTLEDETVAIDGQTAVVTGTAADGEFTFGLVRRGDEWKLATFARDPDGP
jgi:hypothetical protein